jgi:hypothetical protein
VLKPAFFEVPLELVVFSLKLVMFFAFIFEVPLKLVLFSSKTSKVLQVNTKLDSEARFAETLTHFALLDNRRPCSIHRKVDLHFIILTTCTLEVIIHSVTAQAGCWPRSVRQDVQWQRLGSKGVFSYQLS